MQDTHTDPSDIAVGVVIGRSSEFFDFFVYAIASVLVFPQLVFPFLSSFQGTIASFAVFALAFVARPFGTWLFMIVDREYGRGAKLTIAMVLLGTATCGLAFLPSYASVGALSIWMLAVLRIGQGLALGATWDGLASLLAMNAPEGRRGWWAMVPQLSAPLGLIIAAGLFVYLSTSLSEEDFLGWGWRYPFFVAFALNVVALFARLRLVETPEYHRAYSARELLASSVPATMRAEGRNVILGAFAPLASFALFHMVTVFPLSWVYLNTDQHPASFLMIEIVGAFFGLGAVVLSGILADRIGRNSLLTISAIGIAIFSLCAPLLLSAGSAGELVFMIVGFTLLGLSFGQSSGVVAQRLAPAYRYTGSALTTDFAWLFGAAFAPLVALVLAENFGLVAAGIYLLSGAVVTLVALTWNNRLAG